MTTPPRDVEERIDWFLSHNPSDSGMCAQHTWHSLGGNNGNPPAWGCDDANECIDKIKQSGRYWTPSTWSGPPPRGAWVGYKYGSHGHACLSLGDGTIATTDPKGNSGGVGIEDLDYPNGWGASGWTVWTDQYNGVRFAVDGISHGDIWLDKLVYGQMDSDSVRRLQAHLNEHTLVGGSTLPITGNLLEQTAHEIKLCREQHGFTAQIGDEYVTQDQLEHIVPFATCGCVLRLPVETPPPDEPDPIEPIPPVDEPDAGWTDHTFGLWKWYSGKDTDTWNLDNDGEWHKVLKAQPESGISQESSEHHFLYLRCELPSNRTADRTIESKFVRSDGDATAYHSPAWSPNSRDSVAEFNAHFEDGSGLGGQWWVKVSGGNIDITTRYAKTHVYYQDATEIASMALAGSLGRLPLIGGLFRWIARRIHADMPGRQAL